jgi:hypothetical protein
MALLMSRYLRAIRLRPSAPGRTSLPFVTLLSKDSIAK